MQSIGAVLESSQWFGWAPMGDDCPAGSSDGLSSSVFKVSDVVIEGKVIQGPEPTLCNKALDYKSTLRRAMQEK